MDIVSKVYKDGVNAAVEVGNAVGLEKVFSCTACGHNAQHTQQEQYQWKCSECKEICEVHDINV